MTRITVVVLILLAALAASAFAGPTTVHYQGKLTDATGLPVSDGAHQVTFNLYQLETSTLPVWTSPVQSVVVSGGMFSAFFAPTQSVITGNDNLWLGVTVDSQVLTPRLKLNTVPYAIRANTADVATTVPDGSITTAKLSPSVAVVHAPWVTGITSSLPTGLRLRFFLNGDVISPGPVLAESYKEVVEVVEYQDGDDRVIRLRPARLKTGTLVLRRPLAEDNTFRRLAMEVVDGTVPRMALDIVLSDRGGELARWTFESVWPHSYKCRMADDGLPVEEISFTVDSAVIRTVEAKPSSVPVRNYPLSGFVSQQPSGTLYQMVYNSSPIRNLAVAGDAWWEFEIVEYLDPQTGQVVKAPGRRRMKPLTLLQNPLSDSGVFAWYKTVVDSAIQRRDFSLVLSNADFEQRIMDCRYAWPFSYTLKMADDGMPVEEYGIVFEEAVLPQ